MAARIPMSVTHAEFLAALNPLLDLLGAQPNEIVGDIHIIRDDIDPYRICFDVIAPPADEAPSEYPAAIRVKGHPQEDPYAILTHRIEVAVTNS